MADRLITIVADPKLLRRQAALIGRLQNVMRADTDLSTGKDTRRQIRREIQQLEGIWEFLHCVLDHADHGRVVIRFQETE